MIFMSETMFVFNLATLAIVEMSFLLASVAFRCVYCVYQCLPGPPRPPPAPPPPRAPQDTKGMSRLSPRKRRDRKGKDGEKCVSMWCAQKKKSHLQSCALFGWRDLHSICTQTMISRIHISGTCLFWTLLRFQASIASRNCPSDEYYFTEFGALRCLEAKLYRCST